MEKELIDNLLEQPEFSTLPPELVRQIIDILAEAYSAQDARYLIGEARVMTEKRLLKQSQNMPDRGLEWQT